MTYYFGRTSRERLATCDRYINDICHRVMAMQVMDLTIVCGGRGKAAQNEAYHSGLSTKPWPESKHNIRPDNPRTEAEEALPELSRAVDLAPYPVDWKDDLAFARLAGLVDAASWMLYEETQDPGYLVRWGGDWDEDGESNDQTFMDLAHFERLVL